MQFASKWDHLIRNQQLGPIEIYFRKFFEKCSMMTTELKKWGDG